MYDDDRLHFEVMKNRNFLRLNQLDSDVAIAASRDIDDTWHRHMLNSVAYHQDSMHWFSCILNHDSGFGRSKEKMPVQGLSLDEGGGWLPGLAHVSRHRSRSRDGLVDWSATYALCRLSRILQRHRSRLVSTGRASSSCRRSTTDVKRSRKSPTADIRQIFYFACAEPRHGL